MKISNMDERYNNLKLAEKGARISLIAYIVLSVSKLGVGLFCRFKSSVC